MVWCLCGQPPFDTFQDKQVVVARSENGAVTVVFMQLRVGTLQQCSECAQLYVYVLYLSWRNTTPYVSIPRLSSEWRAICSLFSFAMYFCRYFSPFCMNSTISIHFLSQKTVAISFVVDDGYLKYFSLFDEFVCIHCFDSSLVSKFTNDTNVSRSVMMLLRNSSPFWYLSKNVKAKPCSAFCAHPWAFSESMLCKTCGILTWLLQSRRKEYVKFVETHTILLKLCNAGLSLIFLVNTLNKIITHYRWLDDSLTLHTHHEHLFAHPSSNIPRRCVVLAACLA
jgi:hypothetical protein